MHTSRSWSMTMVPVLLLGSTYGCGSDTKQPAVDASVGADGGNGAAAGAGTEGGPGAVDGSSSNTAPPTLPPFTPPATDVIIGRVVDPNGRGIEGVAVTLANAADAGPAATTNYDGYYYIGSVPPADRVTVRFAAPGYVSGTAIGTMFQSGKVHVNTVLRPRGAGQAIDPTQGGSATFSHGVVTLPPSSVTDSNGTPYTGPMRVHVTPIEIKGKEIQAAPGDFTANTAAGQTAQLETFAMGSYELLSEQGDPLKVRTGSNVGVEMLLPTDTTLTEGQTVPAWHFDETAGVWVEEGTGTVAKSSTDPTRLAYRLNVGHFSTWNCDQPYDTTCVSGTITSACDGSAVPGADLRAAGVSYDGTSQAFAGTGGQYCLAVKKGSTVRLVAGAGYGASRVVKAVDVTSGDAVSKCPGPCAVQDIVLPCTPADNAIDCSDDYFSGCSSCVQGRVVDSAGTPVPATLSIKTGIQSRTAVTDAQGHYCAPAPLKALTIISATGKGGSGMVSFTASVKGTCPACEQAPDIVLSGSGSDSSSSNIDFSTCPTDVGGMKVDQLLANGGDPALNMMNAAWLLAEKGSDSKAYTISMFLSSTKATQMAGAPHLVLTLDLPSAPTPGAIYEVKGVSSSQYTFSGSATSSAGSPKGLVSETYSLSSDSGGPSGSGQIRFDKGFANVGDPVQGSFDLTFGPDCAPPSATLRLRGAIDTRLADQQTLLPTSFGLDGSSLPLWECSLFGLMTITTDLGGSGSVQAAVDGVPLSAAKGPSILDGAKYSWKNDKITISVYADNGTFMAEVEHPKRGANPVKSATYLDSNSSASCYWSLGSGTVTLPDFGGADTTRWLTGTFDVNLAPTSYSAADVCTGRKATGQFGAPVCQ